MPTQHLDTSLTKPPYDNTALRERIGTNRVATRSFDELHVAARNAAGTEEVTRSRWSWRRHPR